MFDHLPGPARVAGDVLSAGAIVGAVVGYLPVLAAIIGLAYYSIQIWESQTIQGFVAYLRKRRRKRRKIMLEMKREEVNAHLADLLREQDD